jgi:hypothetical protein
MPPMAYRLYIKDSNKEIGQISDEQLQTLIDLLEEEDDEDKDYYIDKDLLDYLEQEGADPALIALLKPHITDDDGVEIEWREG